MDNVKNLMEVDSPNSLKRCSSAPQINNLTVAPGASGSGPQTPASPSVQTRSVVAASASSFAGKEPLIQPSQFSIFAPRARRFSASFSPLGGNSPVTGPRLAPRISQLRAEECADITNLREVNHEREVHSSIAMSQSCEDLTLIAEQWSFKSAAGDSQDASNNPLHLNLPQPGALGCSSPSPTRHGLRLPYHNLSPSPTRKTFATRRSMSPIAMRPSPLGSVKRKFELDDGSNTYSPPPLKRIFLDSRGSSPYRQSPSPLCPSPESSTSYDGRITPKLFAAKLFTDRLPPNSLSSSPATESSEMDVSTPPCSAAPSLQSSESVSSASSNNGDGANGAGVNMSVEEQAGGGGGGGGITDDKAPPKTSSTVA